MKEIHLKISIGLWSLLVLTSFSPAHAQSKQCPLDLSVTQYQKNEAAVEIPISDANATILNISTKKITKAVLLEGMPRFPKLLEGTYNLTVTKIGYARTLKRIKVDCRGLAADGSVTEDIFLWEGSSDQTMKMRDVSIALSSKDTLAIPSSKAQSSQPVSLGLKTVSGGVLNGKARILVSPQYPAAARAAGASGTVSVQVEINKDGSVTFAKAISGHPLLREAAEKAARASSFSATTLKGQPVEVIGTIIYNFVP